MTDNNAIVEMVKQQIATAVNQHLAEVFASEPWLRNVEEKIVRYSQDRILGKFNSSSSMPEIVDAIKQAVRELFKSGLVPGIESYVDSETIQQSIELASKQLVESFVDVLIADPAWVSKIETAVNQQVIQKTLSRISAMDVNSVIKNRVDETLHTLSTHIQQSMTRTGIDDQATGCELTVMDQHVVVENNFTTKNITVVENAQIKNLTVTGAINTDNESWNELKETMVKNTMHSLTEKWKETLVSQVRESIQSQGIDFESVTVNGTALIAGNQLNHAITHSNIKKLGRLESLNVDGEAHLNQTVSVVTRRLGVNTTEPEMALSVWDEEISVLVGKHKSQTAYVGTGRNQNLCLGVNRETQLEIDINGLTTVKKLRVGVHHISHSDELPGWAGIKGDVVFNANPTVNSDVFAWQCLGGHRWKVIRSAS